MNVKELREVLFKLPDNLIVVRFDCSNDTGDLEEINDMMFMQPDEYKRIIDAQNKR